MVFVSESLNFITLLIVISLTIKDWIFVEQTQEYKFLKNLFLMLPLIALVFIITKLLATSTHTVSFNLMLIILISCSLTLYFRYSYIVAKKYKLGILYGILAIPVIFVALLGILLHFIWITPGGVEVNRVTEPSPNGTFAIELTQHSQGALGGSTEVVVRRARSFNLLIGTLQYRPFSVHRGRFGEFYNIELRWHGDERFYMYRSTSASEEVSVRAFNLTGRTWR